MRRIDFQAAIDSTRNARDNSARAAKKAIVLGVPTLGQQLDELAASYDHLLARLLEAQEACKGDN